MGMIVPTTFYVIRTPHWFAPLFVKSESETTRRSKEALIFFGEFAAHAFAEEFSRKHNIEVVVIEAGPRITGPVQFLT